MNRYSPYHNYDENRTGMMIDDDGSWVHVSKAKDLMRERDEARAEVERLKALLEKKP